MGNAVTVLTSENIASLELIESFDIDTKQISISPNGQMMAVASQHQDLDYSILIYGVQSGEQINAIQGRMDFVRELLWSPDSNRIAVISGRRTGGGVEERSVKIYRVGPGTDQGSYIMGNSDVWHTDYVNSEDRSENPVYIAWSPSSDMLAAAFHERLAILSATQNEELFSAELPGIETVDWSPDGRTITTRTVDRLIQLWGVPESE